MKKLSLKGIVNEIRFQKGLQYEKPEFDRDRVEKIIKENYPCLKDCEYSWSARLDLPHWCWVLDHITVRSYVPLLDHWNMFTIDCKFYI